MSQRDHSSGRAASGGALASQPLRTTRSTPESIRNFPQETQFFFISPSSAFPGNSEGESGTGEGESGTDPGKAELRKMQKNCVFWEHSVWTLALDEVEKKVEFSRLNSRFLIFFGFDRLNPNFNCNVGSTG